MFGKFKKIIPFFIVIVLSYWTFKPMLIKGYFPMHDDTQPVRVLAMAKELKKGIFPVRLVDYLGYGYGYPLYNFYAPLPYYLGSIFYLSGIDLIFATKLMFIAGSILAGISMYLIGSYIGGALYGIVAALLYLYAPYHAVNLYVRGAVGEYYAYAFLPLLAFGILKIFDSKKLEEKNIFKILIPGAVGLAGVLLSHNILGLITLYMLGIFIVIFLFILIYKKISLNRILLLGLMIFLGFGLSAFFTVPAVFEKNYTRVNSLLLENNNYSKHFVTLSQLWESPWGFAGSSPGLDDGLSFKIGKLHIFSALFSIIFLIYLIRVKKIKNQYLYTFIAAFLIALISIFMMLSASALIYNHFPFFNFIQYPWRFLNFAVLALSFMAAYLGLIKNSFTKIFVALILIIGSLAIYGKYFSPNYISSLTESTYLGSPDFNFTTSKISDEYLPFDLTLPDSPKSIRTITTNNELFTIRSLKDETQYKIIKLQNDSPLAFRTNIAFFPGWQGVLDGTKSELKKEEGFIYMEIPKGDHLLELKFKNTPVRKVSNAISFLSFILLLYFALIKSKSLWPKDQRSK